MQKKLTTLFGLGALVAALLVPVVSSAPAASAQIICADWQIGWEVATADEFNQAVDCHNVGWPGTTNIVLLNDITASQVAGAAVFEPISGGDLVIVGAGHDLRRGSGAGADAVPVLAIDTDSTTVIGISQANIVVGSADTAGIVHTGTGKLDLSVVAITADSPGTNALGVQASASTNVRYSLIQGMATGVQMTGSDLFVEQSTIASTSADIELVGTTINTIRNATLGGPVGINFDRGRTTVTNSTIVGEAALPSATSDDTTYVTFQSSIANSCSADEVSADVMPGPGWSDEGNNAGDCFFDSEAVTLSLTDNGCDRRTPAGCPPTAAIDETSAAAGIGLCAPDNSATDQRGAARTPIGAGCDAGSFEASCDPSNGASAEVGDADEFAAAILCNNLGAAGTTNITLLGEISAFRLSDSGAVFPRITGGEVVIIGQGNSIRRSFGAPTTAMPVLAAQSALVRLIEVGILVGPDDTAGIVHDGPGDLRVLASSVSPWSEDTAATGIVTSDDVRFVEMRESTVRGLPVGVDAGSNFSVIIDSSTIESTDVDVAWRSRGAGGIFDSTLAGPTGIALGDGGPHVESSTIFGDGAALLDNETSQNTFVTFMSSIVTACSAPEFVTDIQPGPGWADLGANVGSCLDPDRPVQLTLGDYGCANETPIGCARTAAIDVMSAAFQAGDCGSGRLGPHLVDQRGEARTPVGPGCDAGAFELAPPFLGDVTDNGRVDNADVQSLLVWIAGGAEPVALTLGDVTSDGQVKLDDALALAQINAERGSQGQPSAN